jgi:hypothetical protein
MTDWNHSARATGIPHWDADCARCGHRLAEILVEEGKLTWAQSLQQPMWLCEKCGNKRCPKASWHGYKCTGSNEYVQEPELDDE